MSDERVCGCGDLVPSGRRERWCSSWCRGREEQGLPPQRPPGLAPSVVRVSSARSGPSVREAVERALEAAGMTESWQAVQALNMAGWIDEGTSKGSALAALHRELRSVMAEALRGVDEEGSRVGAMRDELADRRARRAGGA